MGKRLQGIVIGVIVGVVLTAGVAYAVTVVPPSSTDRYYACVNADGAVEHRLSSELALGDVRIAADSREVGVAEVGGDEPGVAGLLS